MAFLVGSVGFLKKILIAVVRQFVGPLIGNSIEDFVFKC